jgi:phosphoribosylaminoimidazolecarboxamide formyltransferase/IMP cyclohydrolase
MIRGAAKNFKDVLVVASKKDYPLLLELLQKQRGETTLEQRRQFAARAFEIVAHYDVVIAQYFNPSEANYFLESKNSPTPLRYGENPHQTAVYYGSLDTYFEQLHGKEISYNNLVDIDAALQLIREFASGIQSTGPHNETIFAIIKHTNVCGIASRSSVKAAWDAALEGDPESAFGGVLVCNKNIDLATSEAINEIFFEVLIAPGFANIESKKESDIIEAKNPGRPGRTI